MGDAVSVKQIADRLLRAERILLLTHEKPDGDAVGSTAGMRVFLRDCGKQADVLFPAALPARMRDFVADSLTSLTCDELKANYDLVLLLDCANPARIAGGDQVDAEFLRNECELLNVDHHVGNSIDGRGNLVDPDAAAASQLAAEIALATGKTISAEAATLWLLGIVTDTGSFRFSNTTGRTMRVAAELLDRGAELDRVINAIYFSKPRRQQEFEADLLQNFVRTALDGRFVYALLPETLFQKYHFDMRDGEGLIDLLREIDGSVIAALVYRKGDAFKISLRSKDARYPVEPTARTLGGGGHPMAAGITLALPDFGAVEQLLLDKITVLLAPKTTE